MTDVSAGVAGFGAATVYCDALYNVDSHNKQSIYSRVKGAVGGLAIMVGSRPIGGQLSFRSIVRKTHRTELLYATYAA